MRNKEIKHKHKWTTSGCSFYHIGGTRLWLFRRCLKCKEIQDAIVDSDRYIKWRSYKITKNEKTN